MFKEMLESIIERTEGSLGALIMGTDGIAVEKVLGQAGVDANLDVAAAEFTSLVRSAQRAGMDTGLGGLRELVVSLDGALMLMRLLSKDYFVVLSAELRRQSRPRPLRTAQSGIETRERVRRLITSRHKFLWCAISSLLCSSSHFSLPA